MKTNNYTKELFNRSIAVLVRAYINNTLEHGNFCACAVGNLLADRIGASIEIDPRRIEGALSRGSIYRWIHPEFNGSEWYYQKLYSFSKDKTLNSIEYSMRDIIRIEKAFEGCVRPDPNCSFRDDQWMFNGLMAVVDVLCEIHGMNEEEKKESKALFVKA